MSEHKTGEQMASEDPRLQETMRRAEKAVRDDLTVAYILGLAEGFRWSAERISVVGACETEEAGGEQRPCTECEGSGVLRTKEWGEEIDLRCHLCGGTGKAKE